MALKLFADAALTLPINGTSPKRFLFPVKGGLKTSTLWIGDPFQSSCAAQAAPGAATISLNDTSEFFDASSIAGFSGHVATATSGTNTFTYTGKTQSSLTGVSGITSTIFLGDKVAPKIIYSGVGGSNIEAFPTGADLLNFNIKVAVGSNPVLSFPGLPAIFSVNQIRNGVSNALQLFISVQVPEGIDKEFMNFAVQVNNVFKRDNADTTVFSTTEGTYSPEGPIYAFRHDQSLDLPIRILPANRRVFPNTPGFIVGDYRWRSDSNRNATTLVPTRWNIDPQSVGLEKFIAGMGDSTDLSPEQLVEVQNSIRMVLHRGEYFTGANRYYLSATTNLEFLQSSAAAANPDGTVGLELQKSPRLISPIFVGTWILDSQGYYEKALEYKYVASLSNPDGSLRTDLPDRYFLLDRKSRMVTLNKSMDDVLVFLGLVSGQAIDYFDMPVYPVDNVRLVYSSHPGNTGRAFAASWSFNREDGTIQIPSIAGALANEPIFALCSPSIAIAYDSGDTDLTEIDTVDLNPAFSGLAQGFFYLQHRRQRPSSLVLSCDKPRIAIPATQASIIGLVAFGPVFFENDFALLSVTAFSNIAGETIPNAKLDVVVDPTTFTGTINYADPLANTVSVITGGDGTANLIFIPKGGFGTWIPTAAASGSLAGVATTSIANDTLVLPDPIPLGQIWNVQESWKVTTYKVLNDDPLFGKVGGDPSFGEIVFHTSGTPGTDTYKTNGVRQAWRTGNVSSGNLILPIDAKDASGHSYTSSSFNGTVKKLVFAQALPLSGNVGAFFVTLIQRVLIRMRLENSNVFSNSILLQMDTPDLIIEDPWLILNDSINGRLNQFRLGYVRRS